MLRAPEIGDTVYSKATGDTANVTAVDRSCGIYYLEDPHTGLVFQVPLVDLLADWNSIGEQGIHTNGASSTWDEFNVNWDNVEIKPSCWHDWVEKPLFTSVQTVCSKCGKVKRHEHE